MAITIGGGISIGGGITIGPPLFNGITTFGFMTSGNNPSLPPSGMSAVTANSSSLLVAVGTDINGYPASATSTDGRNWTKPSALGGTTTSGYMTKIAWSRATNRYMAIGSSGTSAICSTSSNGTTWSSPTPMYSGTSTITINSVAVNSSGLFVAVGALTGTGYPAYSTSTDGITWSTPAAMNGSTTTATITAVTVNSAGLFVAVGYTGSGTGSRAVYATSINGSTWTTPAIMNGSATTAHMQAVAVNSSGLFVAVGSIGNSTTLRTGYATSTDGSTWTTPAQLGNSTLRVTMTYLAVNSSGLFVAVTAQGGLYLVVATSTNGSSWTTPTSIFGSNVPYLSPSSIAVSSTGIFVIVGYNGSGSGYYMYLSSTDGVTWTIPGSSPVNMFSVAVNRSNLYVAVGYDSYTYAPYYATSTDGSTWTSPSLMNGSTTAAYMGSVAVNSSGLFVSVGYDNINYAALYATSTDGSNWTTPAFMNGNSVDTFYMLAVAVNSAGLFLAVGFDVNNYPVYVTSTDGSTWTIPVSIAGYAGIFSPVSVAVSSAGRWVAVGNDGNGRPMYTTSADGATWTTPAYINGVTDPVQITSVAVNSAGLFVAVGSKSTNTFSSSAVYAYSTDGSTWTTPAFMNNTTATTAQIYGVAVNSAGVFVAVGYNNNGWPVYAYSTNGTSWSTPAQLVSSGTETATLNGVTANSSGLFAAVGFHTYTTSPVYATLY